MSDAMQPIGDLALSQAVPTGIRGKLHNNGNIDKTSKDFESMFMSQMLQPMFETIGVNSLFGGGHGEQVMKTFLVQEYGKLAAKGSHFGISDAVKNEMIRAQAATTGADHVTTP